jgi:hypothetical protein
MVSPRGNPFVENAVQARADQIWPLELLGLLQVNHCPNQSSEHPTRTPMDAGGNIVASWGFPCAARLEYRQPTLIGDNRLAVEQE